MKKSFRSGKDFRVDVLSNGWIIIIQGKAGIFLGRHPDKKIDTLEKAIKWAKKEFKW